MTDLLRRAAGCSALAQHHDRQHGDQQHDPNQREAAGLAASRRKNYRGRLDNRTATQTRGGSAPPAAKPTDGLRQDKASGRSARCFWLTPAQTLRSAGAYCTPLQVRASAAIIRQTIHAAATGLGSL